MILGLSDASKANWNLENLRVPPSIGGHLFRGIKLRARCVVNSTGEREIKSNIRHAIYIKIGVLRIYNFEHDLPSGSLSLNSPQQTLLLRSLQKKAK